MVAPKRATTAPDWPRAMSPNLAAAYLGISRNRLDEIKKRGDLDTVLVGGSTRSPKYLREELDEYLDSQRRGSQVPA